MGLQCLHNTAAVGKLQPYIQARDTRYKPVIKCCTYILYDTAQNTCAAWFSFYMSAHTRCVYDSFQTHTYKSRTYMPKYSLCALWHACEGQWCSCTKVRFSS